MDTQPVVLVTGCSQGGIGYSLCVAFSKAGCRVFASARKLDSMQGLEEHGVSKVTIDVTSRESMKEGVQSVVQQAGRLDILVNNAGMGLVGPLAEVDLEEARRVYDTNLFGMLALVQEVFPHMAMRQSGKVVNIGSVTGFISTPYGAVYSSSKAAVHNASDALRLELKPFGIDVIVVAPGAIKSNIGNNNLERMDLQRLKWYRFYEKNVKARATLSQTPKSTPTDVFARQVVERVLKRNPARYIVLGYMTGLIRLLRMLPLWLRDRIVSKKAGLNIRPPMPGYPDSSKLD